MLRRVFTLTAGVSLLGALILSAIWASHLLPPRFWVVLSRHPVKNVSLQFETNFILLVRIEPGDQPIVGPDISDTDGVKTFRRRFAGIRGEQFVFYDKIVEPAFRNSADRQIEMYGTWTIYLVPYWSLLLILGLLPGWRWLPPVSRWFERRFAKEPENVEASAPTPAARQFPSPPHPAPRLTPRRRFETDAFHDRWRRSDLR